MGKKAFSPHHDGTKTRTASCRSSSWRTAVLGMVWLDGRGSGAEHDRSARRFDGALLRELRSVLKQSAENVVNARVCECCQTAAVVTATASSQRSGIARPREIRDVKVSRLEGGKWTPDLAPQDDNWKIDACPINGPALSARGRQVAASVVLCAE